MTITTEALREFIKDNFLFGREPNFSNDESFLDMGLIDSTGVLELVGHLEREYRIKIEDDELVPDNLDSINRIVEFVVSKQAAAWC
ncbi:MAG TPA: acyl carrier protein [Planctomycetaceae bacterium]|nr:acyl carrier protein [Planctomycetaceae bacterium]